MFTIAFVQKFPEKQIHLSGINVYQSPTGAHYTYRSPNNIVRYCESDSLIYLQGYFISVSYYDI